MKNKISNNKIIKGLTFLLKATFSQWRTLMTITVIFLIIVVMLSGLTYLIEILYNTGNNFNWNDGDMSFIDCFWWVYITITTIGYGDIFPLSIGMRIWAIIISLIGMIFIALYTAVIVNGFTNEFHRRRDAGEDAGALAVATEEIDNEVEKMKKENKELRKVIKELKSDLPTKNKN